MAKKSNAGRPTKMNETTISKLEQAFSWGCTDREACLFADINPETLYKYQRENPEFTERKAILKERPVLLAKQTVIEKMTESYSNAMDYLSRKRKDEFGQKNSLELSGEINSILTEGQINKILKGEDGQDK